MNELYVTLPFLQFALSLLLASVVIFSDAKDRRNRLFVLFLFAMAVWGVGIFGMRDSFPDAALALSWEKIVLAAIPFSGIFFYHFVIAYTRKEGRNRLLIAMYGLGVAAAALSLAGQSATSMVETFYGFAPQLGWSFPLVLMAAYPPVILAIYELTLARRNAEPGEDKARLSALRLAAVLAVAGGTSDILPSLGIDIYPMGVVGNLAFVFVATWAVVRYRLMELRLVLRRGLAYIAISSLVFAVYGVAYGALWLLAQNLSATAVAIAAFGAVVMVGLFVQPIVGQAQTYIDRLFFRERADRLSGIARIGEMGNDIADLKALTVGLVDTMRKGSQSDWIALLLTDRTGRDFITVADTRSSSPAMRVAQDGAIAARLERLLSVLPAEATESTYAGTGNALDDGSLLTNAGARLLIPLAVKGSLTGMIFVGPKLVGSGYTTEDIKFLKTAADQAATSLENSRLYAAAKREARERTALAELGRVVNSTLDLENVFQRCEQQVQHLLSYDRFVITTVDHENGMLTDAFVHGTEVPGWGNGHVHPIKGSPLEPVIASQTGMILNGEADATQYDDYPARAASRSAGLSSMLAVPLISAGQVIGTMNLKSTTRNAYFERHLELAERVGAQIATAIANSQHYERSLQLAAEREARMRLDADNRELQRVNEAKSKFLSLVSHELKTPLASILGFAEILLRNKEGNLAERQIQGLQVIERNGRSLNSLVNDLVDVGRGQSGDLNIERSEFDARELIDELSQSFVPILEGRNQTLSVSRPDGHVYVEADRDRIAQVLTNLVSNASKYSPEETEVELSMWEREGRLYFSVRDHGIGMSAEDQQKLFTPFFRADNEETRAVSGTGLGLVITKNIIEKHGGELQVESEVGVGTTMQFYLSAARAEEHADSHQGISVSEEDCIEEIVAAA
ncbi:MAG: GAF domain-containing protein [Chloroflexi bacterium]|nr:GAF domain-containing protein [Chloroflexota bacterium]